MNVKCAVLMRLEENRGSFISGKTVAEELGVSRQAVSKAVNALKREGYEIAAVSNRGYMLDSGCDKLSASVISQKTGTKVFFYESVTSTNVLSAQKFSEYGECIVVSNFQSEGRKKDGGTFYSPRDKGIYFSIAMPLNLPLDSLEALRKICGKAAAEVINSTCGKKTEIINCDEVYIDGKKVCGILIECTVSAAAKSIESAVIGIGIYTSETCFSDTALSSIFPDETRNNIIAEIYLKIKSMI